MNILLIMASGKNTRFDGNPKIFAEINGVSNIQNTYTIAKNIFDEVYISIDRRYFSEYNLLPKEIKQVHSIGGKGDLFSIYHSIKKLKLKEKDRIFICWGDAVFLSPTPFIEFMSQIKEESIYVAVSKDENPYAWFLTENSYVKESLFRKFSGSIENGIHDQSLFCINYSKSFMETIKVFLQRKIDGEYKIINFLSYLYSSIYKAKCIYISEKNVFSFNTKKELEKIQGILC